MMHQDQLLELIGKHLTGENSPKEQEQLIAELNETPEAKTFFEEVDKTWQMSRNLPTTTQMPDMEAAWKKIDQRTLPQIEQSKTTGDKPAEGVPTKVFTLRRYWQIAAVVAALVVAGFAAWQWSQSPQQELQTPVLAVVKTGAETKKITLPDGSLVELNKNSSLTYDTDFSPRVVHLTGEAFFEVQKQNGASFEVYTPYATTTVLGTAFNVRAYETEATTEVSVREGKVAVTAVHSKQQSASPANVILEANQAAVVTPDETNAVSIEKVQADNATAWKDNALSFNDHALADVITAVERYYGVKIEVANPALLNCRFLGTFNNASLSEVLDGMAFTMNLTYTRQDNAITLRGVGCQ